MNETIQAFPLQWPVGWKRTQHTTRSLFKNDKTIDKSCKEIKHQLEMMRADGIIISTNIPIRGDGLPYSSYKVPEDKGAAVYFTLKKIPHVLACDKWDKIEHNLWAIAKHIEALRSQDRWGVGNLEQSFAGFKALPERASEIPQLPWWEILEIDEPRSATEASIISAYKALAKIYHPDVVGGSELAMQKLNQAKEEALIFLQK